MTASPPPHDLFRKPGSFDETLRLAGCIKRSGMWLVLMSTVSSMNAAELPDMIGLVARIGADVFAFGRYCPTKGQRLEKCDRCKLRGWCRGCPAVAAGYTGNRYAPDPQCWMEVD